MRVKIASMVLCFVLVCAITQMGTVKAQEGGSINLLGAGLGAGLGALSGAICAPIGALGSILISLITSICAIPMQMLWSCIAPLYTLFCAPIFGLLGGVISMPLSIFGGEILSVINSINGIISAACCVPNIILYVVWLLIFAVLNLWIGVGHIAELIFSLVQLTFGTLMGFIGAIVGCIPIVSAIYGLISAVVFIVWSAIWVLLDIAGYGLPSGILVVVSSIFSVIATTYMPEMSKSYLAVMGLYLANLGTWAGSFGLQFVIQAMGIITPASSSWCGGINGCMQYLFLWGGSLIMMLKVIVSGIIWLITALIALFETLTAIPSAIVDMVKNVCGV